MEELQSSYVQSFIHDDYRVLGRKLKPLTFKKYLRLHAISSPFIYNTSKIDLSALELAVVICSTEEEEPLDAIKYRSFSPFKKARYMVWSYRNARNPDLEKEFQNFGEYIADYSSGPRYLETSYLSSSDGEKSNTLPWPLLRKTFLMTKAGFTSDEVDNMTLGEVLWFTEAASYMETGKTNVITSRMEYILDLAEKQKQKGLTV